MGPERQGARLERLGSGVEGILAAEAGVSPGGLSNSGDNQTPCLAAQRVLAEDRMLSHVFTEQPQTSPAACPAHHGVKAKDHENTYCSNWLKEARSVVYSRFCVYLTLI